MAASASRTIWSSLILQTARRIAVRITSETEVPSRVSISSACRVSSSARKLICVTPPDGASDAFLAGEGVGPVAPVSAGATFVPGRTDLAAGVDLAAAAVLVAGSAPAARCRYVRLGAGAFFAAVAVAAMVEV